MKAQRLIVIIVIIVVLVSCKKEVPVEPGYQPEWPSNYFASLIVNDWQPSSLPWGITGLRNYVQKSGYIGLGHLGGNSDLLKFEINTMQPGQWDTYHCKIEEYGTSFSNLKSFSIWLYPSIDDHIKLIFDVGVISEDANRNLSAMADTEDNNYNGILDAGEDVGISNGIYQSDAQYWGENNGLIDTEDRNFSGQTDFVEKGVRYTAIINSGQSGSWINIIFDLKDDAELYGDALNVENSIEYVKDIRIMVTSPGTTTNATGYMIFDELYFFK